ncbi:MAG: YbjN domain-containing protein, partial [Gemmatimonadaceae bacterium]
GYRYQQIDAQSLIVTLRCERAVYGVFFGANDSTNLVRLTTSYGSTVPEDRRVAIAEAVTRINARFSFGNFDLDFEDGELRFRIGIDVEDGLLSEQMVNNMLGCALQAMDRFHPALMRIAFGDVEPAAAIAEVP